MIIARSRGAMFYEDNHGYHQPEPEDVLTAHDVMTDLVIYFHFADSTKYLRELSHQKAKLFT